MMEDKDENTIKLLFLFVLEYAQTWMGCGDEDALNNINVHYTDLTNRLMSDNRTKGSFYDD